MTDIFVNYRHDDGHAADRLADLLAAGFSTFIDTGLKAGAQIDREIEAALDEAKIVIAILGKEWFSPRNLERLKEPDDWIHRELKRAFQKSACVIPVIVDEGLSMPEPEQLPEALLPLRMRKLVRLHRDSWKKDVAGFFSTLQTELGARPAVRASPPLPVPNEIPYLCDRVPQEHDFQALALAAKDRRTFVCILHGHQHEAHSKFVTRLQHRHTFAAIFGTTNIGVDVYPLDWNPSEARDKRFEDLLRSALKRNPYRRSNASDDDLYKFLRIMPRPAVLMLEFAWSDLKRYGRTLIGDLQMAWENIVAQLGGIPSQPLLLWINLSYENARQKIEAGDQSQLEKLGPVRRSDIQSWLNHEDVRKIVIGYETALLNIASDQRYYIVPGEVHMQRFAEAVHELLNSRR